MSGGREREGESDMETIEVGDSAGSSVIEKSDWKMSEEEKVKEK